LAKTALADPPDEFERGIGSGLGMIGKIAMAEKRLGTGGLREISDLVRHEAKIGGNPDRTETEGRKHRPEHLVAVLGVNENAVAFDNTALGQGRRQRRGSGIDLTPGPRPVAPDEACAVAVTPRILGQE